MKKTQKSEDPEENGKKEPLIDKKDDFKSNSMIEDSANNWTIFKRNPYEDSWLLQLLGVMYIF